MRGNPKFKEGDKVTFKCGNKDLVGTVFIVDKYGTFDNPSDVSYDILVEEENCLYKHLTEKLVNKYEAC